MMGLLYDVETQTINYHLKKVFGDSKLAEERVIRHIRISAADGKVYNTQHYKLAAIIAVGYKVNLERAVQFRKWAICRWWDQGLLFVFAYLGDVLRRFLLRFSGILMRRLEAYLEKVLFDQT
jgi:hypothetical protein